MPTMHRASAPPLEGGVSAGNPRGAVSCVSYLFASAGAGAAGRTPEVVFAESGTAGRKLNGEVGEACRQPKKTTSANSVPTYTPSRLESLYVPF